MFFDFSVPLMPSFIKMDLSELPALIGAFAMGPVPALFIQIVKIVVKLLLKPTSTAFVGEAAAFVCSSALTVTAGAVYSRNKTKKNAVKGMAVGTAVMVLVASIANYAIIIPAYVQMFHLPLEAIVAMGHEIFPAVKDKLSFVLCCVLPFNLIKAVLVNLLTFFLYKHISPLLKAR